jgi:hypothetical protein
LCQAVAHVYEQSGMTCNRTEFWRFSKGEPKLPKLPKPFHPLEGTLPMSRPHTRDEIKKSQGRKTGKVKTRTQLVLVHIHQDAKASCLPVPTPLGLLSGIDNRSGVASASRGPRGTVPYSRRTAFSSGRTFPAAKIGTAPVNADLLSGILASVMRGHPCFKDESWTGKGIRLGCRRGWSLRPLASDCSIQSEKLSKVRWGRRSK